MRWRDRGPCKTAPDLFFPEKLETRKADKAMRMCMGCPVRADCLDHAIAQREEHGIWGGTTPAERDRLRRSRTAA
ncbi:WhiB family transcriptional regulator [Rhodococcus hoagii]|nr:WhiB family transcriptional regulator [Prescottella equi]NKS61647.1 WhiB family transcriptional regulator [Prescottella equi]NKZ93248.1 WhiB family transcriptional regulator [Prescottella equi]